MKSRWSAADAQSFREHFGDHDLLSLRARVQLLRRVGGADGLPVAVGRERLRVHPA